VKTWQKGAVGVGLVALVYSVGHRDGENPPAPGGQPASVVEAENAKNAILGHVNAVTGFGQGIVVEGGEVLQTGGNAVSGAGGAVSENTVPAAPPK
jgi:hypothetical protein